MFAPPPLPRQRWAPPLANRGETHTRAQVNWSGFFGQALKNKGFRLSPPRGPCPGGAASGKRVAQAKKTASEHSAQTLAAREPRTKRRLESFPGALFPPNRSRKSQNARHRHRKARPAPFVGRSFVQTPRRDELSPPWPPDILQKPDFFPDRAWYLAEESGGNRLESLPGVALSGKIVGFAARVRRVGGAAPLLASWAPVKALALYPE